MRTIIFILTLLAMIVSAIWTFVDFGYEPLIAFITSALGLLYLYKKSKNIPSINQRIRSGKNSKNIQIGSINIGNEKSENKGGA